MDLGNRIKKARMLRNLTQKQLAQKLGVAEITIRQYELNKREPKAEQIKRIADILETPILYFYVEEGIYLDNINDAKDEWDLSRRQSSAYDGVLAILGDIYGGFENRIITGEYGSTGLYIFGKGETAFTLSDEDIVALQESINGIVRPIVERLKSETSVEDDITEVLKFLNDTVAKKAVEKYYPTKRDS